MRSPTIRLVDFTGGAEFRDALTSTTSVIRSIASVGYFNDSDEWIPREPLAHVDFVSSADEAVLNTALAGSDLLVLHLASHTHGRGEGEPAFFRREHDLPVSTVAQHLQASGRGVAAACVLIDGCNGGTAAFSRAIRDCLQQDI